MINYTKILPSKPGTGIPLASLGGVKWFPKPTQVAAMAWAVSVCHQLSKEKKLVIFSSSQTLTWMAEGTFLHSVEAECPNTWKHLASGRIPQPKRNVENKVFKIVSR